MKHQSVLKFVLIAVLLCLLIPSFALAQSAATGALTGTVTDPTGSVVPNATVTATSETAQSRTATTGANGSYEITLLPPGHYRVRFEAAGFQSVEVPAVTVTVTEVGTLNRQLVVGAQTQEVTVEANVETVQTASSTVGTVVNTKVHRRIFP